MPEAIKNNLNTDFSIRKTHLLYIYLIIPISIVTVLIDVIFLNGEIRKNLPISPEGIFLLTIFFNLPHIVASNFSFFDTEYVHFYKKKLVISAAAIIFSIWFIQQFFGPAVFFLIIAIWTMIHVIGQQFGITRMFTNFPKYSFLPWKWLGIFISIVMYLDIYLESFIPETSFGAIHNYITMVIIAALFPFTVFTVMVSKAAAAIGKKYLWANYAMVVFIALFYYLKYPFFVVLIPRFIHDVTAFFFYIAHDHNRAIHTQRNFFYNLGQKWALPIAILCPLTAILFAFPLTYFRDLYWVSFFAITLTFFHYYTESISWKKGSLHRKYIILVP